MQARDILGSIPFFAEVLNPSALDVLATNVRLADFPEGSTIIREDDVGDSMFVLVSGEISVSVRGEGGLRRVATLGPGDIFGEMSLMTGARRSATLTATDPVTALEITKASLEPILAGSPELVGRFAAMLERRQAELDAIDGAGRWNTLGLSNSDLRSLIQVFFGGGV
jgi:CRP-like cAMP-binding protein